MKPFSARILCQVARKPDRAVRVESSFRGAMQSQGEGGAPSTWMKGVSRLRVKAALLVLGLCCMLGGAGNVEAQFSSVRLGGGTVYGAQVGDPYLELHGTQAGFNGGVLGAPGAVNNWIVELWVGLPGTAECNLVTTPEFRTTLNNGVIGSKVVSLSSIPGLDFSSDFAGQIRVFDGGAAKTWAQASNPANQVLHGSSEVFIGASGTIFFVPSIAGRWQSFNVHLARPATIVSPEFRSTGNVDAKPNFSGFISRVHQIGVQRIPGDVNWTINAERQLAHGYVNPDTGVPYPNLVDLDKATAEKGEGPNFFVTEVINWDKSAAAQMGWFNPNNPIPGIPTEPVAPRNQDSIAAEIRGFVFLNAGVHRWGVHSDDGFRLSFGRGKGDIGGIVVGEYNGGRGPSESVFDFEIQEPGYYMMRCDWWQGVGDAEIEIYTVDACTGQRVLLNDPSVSSAPRVFWSGTDQPFCRSVLPPINDVGVELTQPVVFELVDDIKPVDPSTLRVRIREKEQPFKVRKVGRVTTVTVPAPETGYDPGSFYAGTLQFNDRLLSFSFVTTTLPAGTFFIEAEDFNYGAGRSNPKAGSPGLDVNRMPYYGGAYDKLSATHEVDYHVGPNHPTSDLPDVYRIGEKPNRPMTDNIVGDQGYRGSYLATTSYRIGWWEEGEWLNYTRTPQPGKYLIYAAMSYGSTEPLVMTAFLSQVLSTPAKPDQNLEYLGLFQGNGTGAWGLNGLVPLINQKQVPYVLVVDSEKPVTLRYTTANIADLDYLALVPTGAQLPILGDLKDQSWNEDTASPDIPISVNHKDFGPDPLVVTAASDNQTLISDFNVVVSGAGANRSLKLTPNGNQNGTANIVVTVRDPRGAFVRGTFTAIVRPVDDPPNFDAPGAVRTVEDVPTGDVNFFVADSDTPAANLIVTAVSADTNLIPNANILISGQGNARRINVIPAPNAFGTNFILLRLTDGTSTNVRPLRVDVAAVNDTPVVSVIPDQNVGETLGTATLPFTVSDVEDPASSLVVTATSSNTSVVPAANLILGGSGTNRTLRISATTAAGSSTIAVSARDSLGAVGSVRFVVSVIQRPRFDFGDAPDTYRTSLAANGARHAAPSPGTEFPLAFGNRWDVEFDATPSADARGDDDQPPGPATNNDEDGATFPDPLYIGTQGRVLVYAYAGGLLDAWIDFNRDGDFEDAGERIANRFRMTGSPNQNLSFVIPTNAVAGTTYARFRLTGNGIDSPFGLAPNGEVEDYRISLQNPLQEFGDAPDSYRTTLAANGARHAAPPIGTEFPLALGSGIDFESDGTPGVDANGDDLSSPPAVGSNDEDGITFGSLLFIGLQGNFDAFAYQGGRLDAWIDFNRDGDFEDAGERILNRVQLPAGFSTNIQFNIPTNAVEGVTYARFRLTAQGIDIPYGPGPVGEVEDYRINLYRASFDFGDAPELATGFPTTLARDGARHVILPNSSSFFAAAVVAPRISIRLGLLVDPESDGKPRTDAQGDDEAGTLDDEDGVRFITPLIPGQRATAEIYVPTTCFLDGWIDYQRNRNWSDAIDKLFVRSVILRPGTNTVGFDVPADAVPGFTYARFRASRTGSLSFSGFGGEGEVEDYQVEIQTPARCDYTCTGTNFWLTFPGNYAPDPVNQPRLSLCILGGRGVTGKVQVAGLGFSTDFSISGITGSVTVDLPEKADLENLDAAILDRGIRVVSTGPVSVYALNSVTNSSDGFLALPSDVLGREYLVQAYPNVQTGKPRLNGSQFAVVATEDATVVSITPSIKVAGKEANVPFNVTLNAGQCYQLRSTNDVPGDLSGTLVVASRPIGVFGGHRCANVPDANSFFCDYVVEQLMPIRDFGRTFYTWPLGGRSGGDLIRVQASENDTIVSLNGSLIGVLQRGQTLQRTVANGAVIAATRPIAVTQFATSSDVDGRELADPFMLNAVPVELWPSRHVICTGPRFFDTHYLNILVSESARNSVFLDGVQIPATEFQRIGASVFFGLSRIVSQGTHTVTADGRLFVSVYGWGRYDSYGWPGCIDFGDVTPPFVSAPANVYLAGTNRAPSGACAAILPNLIPSLLVTDACSDVSRNAIQQIPAPGTLLDTGAHVIQFRATDNRGNVGTAETKVYVIEIQGQYTLECPKFISVACEDSTGAIVNFNALAVPVCGDSIPLQCTPPSGSRFPIGDTLVTCVFTNDTPVISGSGGLTCTFTVRVECVTVEKTIQVTRNNLGVTVLTWSPDIRGVLERAPTVLGPWTIIPNAQSPFEIRDTTRAPFEFFRYRRTN